MLEMNSPLVVIKLGGSLLTLPDWPARLKTLIDHQASIRPVVIAGGGRMVDTIREWNQTFTLGEETCHQLALEALDVTASLVARMIPRSRLVETRQDAELCWSRQEIPILRRLQNHCDELPRTWEVTSDSLAGEVARLWHADELWLLKSTDLPAGTSLTQAGSAGLVDPFFGRFDGVTRNIKWCNLRDAQRRLIPVTCSDSFISR